MIEPGWTKLNQILKYELWHVKTYQRIVYSYIEIYILDRNISLCEDE